MSFDPAAVGLCAPTLVADLAVFSTDDLDAVVAAARAAGTSRLDMFSSHLVSAGSPAVASAPPAADGRTVVDTIDAIRRTNAGAPVWLTGEGAGRTRDRLASEGVTVEATEVLFGWTEGPGAGTVAEAEGVCGVAELVGSRLVVAACGAVTVDLAAAALGLARVADIAREVGAEVAVEWLPGRGVPSLAVARDVVAAAGRDNVGYVLDTLHWHFQPGGPDWDTLASVPPEQILFVQVSDGSSADVPDGRAEPSVRRLPGEGEIDLSRLLGALHRMGADPFVASEVFNRPLLGDLGASAFARTVTDATRALLS